jgi:hypothetical protein
MIGGKRTLKAGVVEWNRVRSNRAWDQLGKLKLICGIIYCKVNLIGGYQVG